MVAWLCICWDLWNLNKQAVSYCIVGFYKVLKFRDFADMGRFVKFKSLKILFCVFYLCAAEMIRENKTRKTASTEFKY